MLTWPRDLCSNIGLICSQRRSDQAAAAEGILQPDDAERCVAAGANGAILSNHGGRRLDAAVSPLDVLAESRARISAPILIDSGYRRDTDVVKALALGANAVLLGRAMLYGSAEAAEAGVGDVLRLLQDEADRTLAQIGGASASQLSPDLLHASVYSQLSCRRSCS